MGFLDELKDKAEEFAEKAKDGLGTGQDKTEEVIENVKDRFDGDDASATAQDSAESIGESAEGATGAEAASVDEALGAHEAAGDRTGNS
jgi:hypothetical protein